ncbi:MAG: hypothetical protein J7501_13015 [Bdellovibrio sp.]|nr:hypothetical protein [Bdellovibrio sp.]
MLIKCPRCGFQQPKDKYCAQCGVDMESFKPAAPPWYQQFFGNPLVQVGLLLVVAGSAGFYIYQRGRENMHDRVTYLKSNLQINASQKGAVPTPPTTEFVEESADPEHLEAASTDAPAAVSLAATKTDVTPSPEAKKDATRNVAKINGPHLIVYYAEVPRSALGRIVDASRGTGQFMSFSDYTAGILPGIDRRMDAPGVKILHREDRPIDAGKTLQWFYGLKDRRNPNVEIGLTTFFELADIDTNNMRGNLEIQRTWREAAPAGNFEIQRKSFPAIFEIGGGTGFFLSGVMPTQSNLENEDELTSIDVYKILRSPQFRAGDSEFVIFIEFGKGN